MGRANVLRLPPMNDQHIIELFNLIGFGGSKARAMDSSSISGSTYDVSTDPDMKNNIVTTSRSASRIRQH